VGRDIRTVAVCTASPALTAILSAVLAGKVGLRVREFESPSGLVTYMRLAPVALLVCDMEDAELVSALRADDRIIDRDFDVVALSRTLTRAERETAAASGIDEVVLKPMSPAYLLERVVARLEQKAERIAPQQGSYRGRERRRSPSAPVATYRRATDNVVQLFPDSWQPNP
jgi:two-component system phosphate regulon response regulator PhoB